MVVLLVVDMEVAKVEVMVVDNVVGMEGDKMVGMGNSLKVAMEVPLQLQVAVMEVPLQQEQTIPRHPLVAMEVLVNMVNLLTDNQLVPHMVELDLTIVQQDMLPLQHLPMAQQAQRHLPVTLLVVVVDMVHQVMVLVDMEEVNKAGVKSLCSSLIFYVCQTGCAAYWSGLNRKHLECLERF